MIVTEKLGKIFEKAICNSLGINFNGTFRYSMDEYTELENRLECLPNYFPGIYQHTGSGGSKYDFSRHDEESFISAKTNKNRNQKVAPYGIGQAKPSTFCHRIGIQFIDIYNLKKDIQNINILTEIILPKLETNTFDVPIIYFNKKDDTIQIIRQINRIPWDTQTYNWTRYIDENTRTRYRDDNNNPKKWGNSSSLKISGKSILEVQFHTRSRTNMAIRWYFKNVLEMFPEYFNIISI